MTRLDNRARPHLKKSPKQTTLISFSIARHNTHNLKEERLKGLTFTVCDQLAPRQEHHEGRTQKSKLLSSWWPEQCPRGMAEGPYTVPKPRLEDPPRHTKDHASIC